MYRIRSAKFNQRNLMKKTKQKKLEKNKNFNIEKITKNNAFLNCGQ